MNDMDIVFLSGVRTPFGAFGGALKDFSAIQLGTIAAKGAIEKAGVLPKDIQHVVFGNVLQTSKDAIYLARHIGLYAAVPIEVPALTVNRLCGSGFEAIAQGAKMIKLEEADCVLVGGTESMSQAPHVIRGARWGLRLNSGELEDYLWDGLLDPYCGCQMAMTAENLAGKYKISRRETDIYAHLSQKRAQEGWDSGRIAEEIVPVAIKDRKGMASFFDRDEHLRPDTTLDGLAKLRPYFKGDGTVTAGNASGIVDGAAAIIICSRTKAEGAGLQPIGRLLSWGNAGVEPEIMGIGPVDASKVALRRAGLTLDQIDLIEINEAFSPQYLAVEKELGLDRERTNVNGGAIAIGHPLGATGARLTLTLLHELRRRGNKYGLASACIGGGQGMAVVIEAL
jgi:acetyl-CoA acetyltransferase family protein